jgi:hypothetical protein
VPQIIANGFDPSYNVRSAYDPGVYFANKAKYSSKYMFASRDVEPTFMFLEAPRINSHAFKGSSEELF